jgi:hypothetical protein
MYNAFVLIPWASLVCAAWATIRLGHYLVLDLATPPGLVLLCAAIFALVVEFFKSGDVGLGAFIRDLTLALLTLAAGVVTLTLLVQRDHVTVLDGIVFTVLVLDAWLSPINAFRTALRNISHDRS